MPSFVTSRLFWIGALTVIVALVLPTYVSGYVLGLLTVAYYTAVFAMSWDLLFGFAGEVNFGPTFLIGVGAYSNIPLLDRGRKISAALIPANPLMTTSCAV